VIEGPNRASRRFGNEAASPRLQIGVGRDAAEVAFTTVFGKTTTGTPKVWIERVDGVSEQERTTDAISIEAP
jgi:hypothetical protein